MGSGFFIVFEGLDGSGKTTVSKAVAERLKETIPNQETIWTCEPANEYAAGEFIRQVLRKEVEINAWDLAMAFAVNRLDHLNRLIIPAMKKDKIIVCDRYLMSSLVYQSMDGVHIDHIADFNLHAIKPDLTIFLDCSPSACAERIKARGNGVAPELFEHRLRAARTTYLSLEQRHLAGVMTVDASQDFEQVVSESVALALWEMA